MTGALAVLALFVLALAVSDAVEKVSIKAPEPTVPLFVWMLVLAVALGSGAWWLR